jgi:hypothetical protein
MVTVIENTAYYYHDSHQATKHTYFEELEYKTVLLKPLDICKIGINLILNILLLFLSLCLINLLFFQFLWAFLVTFIFLRGR